MEVIIYLLLGAGAGGVIGAMVFVRRHKMEQQKRKQVEAMCLEKETQLLHEKSELEIRLRHEQTELETLHRHEKSKLETQLRNDHSKQETQLRHEQSELETQLLHKQSELEKEREVHQSELEIRLRHKQSELDTQIRHKQSELEREREVHQSQRSKLETQLRREQSELEKERESHQVQREKCARLESSTKANQEHEQSLDARLEQAAVKSLEALDKRYAERGKNELGATVKPLQEAFKQFREQLERQGHETTRERTTLVEGLKNVREINESLAHEAQELVSALRRSPQVRGSWGEVQLGRILEAAGLQEGVDYHTQKSYRNEDGTMVRPDIVIELPTDRQVIIDSKLNMVDYLNAHEAKNEETKNRYLKAHLTAMRKHVKDLATKNYQDLPQVHSLDFVLMFVPLENALAAALSEDSSLFDESLRMRVGLVTLNTLMPTLRIIENLWRSHRQQENTQKIVRQATSFYDKVGGVLKSTEDLGKNLERASKSHETVMRKLATGRGNLVSQAKKLEELGIQGKKALPKTGTVDDLEATPALAEGVSDENDRVT